MLRTLRGRLTLLYGVVALFALLAVGGAAVVMVAADIAEDNRERAAQGLPPQGIEPLQRSLLIDLGVALPAALVVAGIGGWLIAGRALKPLRTIAEVTRAISADDLARRLPTGGGAEVDALATALNGLFQRLERSLADVSRFTANAAHELRTPLAATMGRLEVELLHGKGEASARDTIGDALDELQRMRALCDGLLVLARADAGQLSAASATVDLAAVAARVVERDRPLAEDRGIALRLDAGAAFTRGDPQLLERAVGNLVSNAVAYGRAGGVVAVAVAVDARSSTVRVEDDGPGVPTDERARLFDRFFRGAAAREQSPRGGFGLGLSIARGIVEAHGGAVTYAPRDGGGSVFAVRLPVAAPAA
jgi:two-component system OmpR family sensor kinase